MEEDRASDAIDHAFYAQIEKLFGVLCANLVLQHPTASQEFVAGIHLAREAYPIATSALENS
jgi:hypothetical protein